MKSQAPQSQNKKYDVYDDAEVEMIEEQENGDQEEENPQYTEIDGKMIKLGGLDYDLLKEQKLEEQKSKQNFMNLLKTKMGTILQDISLRSTTPREVGQLPAHVHSSSQSVQKYKSLQKCIVDHSNIKTSTYKTNSINEQNMKKSEEYLHFHLNQFDLRVPTTFQKRMGKGVNQVLFLDFDTPFIHKLGDAITQINKAKLTGGGQGNPSPGRMLDQDSDDDMFGSDGSQDIEQPNPPNNQPNPPHPQSSVRIQIGKKLTFDLEQDIFSTLKRPKPIGSLDLMDDLHPHTPSNKYSFMPQKRKPVLNGQQDEGYGECYYQSGPSLQELVDLKKQGIQYYGDLKEFKQKERKVNINRQYQMVQRIIQKKKQTQ